MHLLGSGCHPIQCQFSVRNLFCIMSSLSADTCTKFVRPSNFQLNKFCPGLYRYLTHLIHPDHSFKKFSNGFPKMGIPQIIHFSIWWYPHSRKPPSMWYVHIGLLIPTTSTPTLGTSSSNP